MPTSSCKREGGWYADSHRQEPRLREWGRFPADGKGSKTERRGTSIAFHIGNTPISGRSSLASHNEGIPKSSGGDAAGFRNAGPFETSPWEGSADRLFASCAVVGSGAPVVANALLVGNCAKGEIHRPPSWKHPRTQRGRSQRDGIGWPQRS